VGRSDNVLKNSVCSGLRLLDADSGFQTRHDRCAINAIQHLALHHHRDTHIGRDTDFHVIKALHGDSDYGEGIVVDADLLADDLRVGAKTPAPEVVANHRHELRAWHLVIGIAKDAAKMRTHAQHSKEIAGDQLSLHALCLTAVTHRHL